MSELGSVCIVRGPTLVPLAGPNVEAELLLEIAQAQAVTDQALDALKVARQAELDAKDAAVHADRVYGNACERQRKLERVLEAYRAIDDQPAAT